MTERHFTDGMQNHGIEATCHLAWAALNRAGREPADFDTFLDSIADVEQGQEVVDPTPATPSPTTSSS